MPLKFTATASGGCRIKLTDEHTFCGPQVVLGAGEVEVDRQRRGAGADRIDVFNDATIGADGINDRNRGVGTGEGDVRDESNL